MIKGFNRTFEIRDPIYGFIVINDWEREIINHPIFQRLRRIRQLAWTDMVYPGATHTRFEHSLGVMHIASQMFVHIVKRRRSFLESELNYVNAGLERDYVLVRLAGLLHDVGHPPFSHAGEGLLPIDPETNRPYKHENYSGAIIANLLADVIENHPLNQNYGIKAQEIADFLNGRVTLHRSLVWRELISGQLDADRADYLLRDSHHIGVAYGRFDLSRLLATLTVAMDPDINSPVLAVEYGGAHAAEGLILSRYMMFTQVYFQHTRRAYDHHIAGAIKSLLAQEQRESGIAARDVFPPPTSQENIKAYLEWNDWRVLGMINDGGGGEDGRILCQREHHRRVYETSESPQPGELEFARSVQEQLGADVAFIDRAENSWYKFGKADVKILREDGQEKLLSLSSLSSVVHGLKAINQIRIYVPYHKKEEAKKIIERMNKEKGVSDNDEGRA